MQQDCFHPLTTDIAKPEKFTFPFCYEPHPLCLLAADEVKRHILTIESWQQEIGQGKMFGVLVVEQDGRLGYLAAYSGQIDGRNDWKFFVPPVYDILQPDGHFKTKEKEITLLNREIHLMEKSDELKTLRDRLKHAEEEANDTITHYKIFLKKEKSKLQGEQLISRSQFLNAELRRIRKRNTALITAAKAPLLALEEEIAERKQQRKKMSDELQHWIFSKFRMLNAQGEYRDLCDIFGETPFKIPPSGAGECCAPKLLQYAFLHHFTPICMAEFWWGASPKTEVRHHLHFYPACRGKCKPILEHMMKGLDVDSDPRNNDDITDLQTVYDDECICVINKPAGMLSVPGKSARRSVLSEMKRRYPKAEGPMIVHRLDMDTSGLMVVAKTKEAYINLQRQFCDHTIRKTYVAVLSRKPDRPSQGTISLPLRCDLMDRPRQVVDYARGKEAVTNYEIFATSTGKVTARLCPLTGRTHQLRLHCAHKEGLDAPIVGDTLYGTPSDRLYLHAQRLQFKHPSTGVSMTFEVKVDF